MLRRQASSEPAHEYGLDTALEYENLLFMLLKYNLHYV